MEDTSSPVEPTDSQQQPENQSVQSPSSDQQVVQPEATQSASLGQSRVQSEQPQSQSQPQASESPLSAENPQSAQEATWPNSTNLAIPQLHLPFIGSYSVSFAFGDQPTVEAIKQKFSEWGIVGHHGIDYQLPEATEVVAADVGKVIQAGENGDFGNSVIIQHTWGVSLYAHLKEVQVQKDQEIKAGDVIGLSGQTGTAFGAHLHFGIKPNSLDQTNGYLGFVDPSPYLPAIPIQKEEPKPQEQPQISQSSQTPQIPQNSQPQEPQRSEEQLQSQTEPQIQAQPQVIEKVVEKEVVKEVPVEVIKEVIKEVPIVDKEEVQKQVEEKLKSNLDEKRKLANEERKKRKTENLQKIMEYAREKKTITNEDIQKLLHVSQSTATNYLTELTNQGMLKKQGDRGGTKYTY